MLAAQAAVAIENARLYESATRWLAQLESLNEIVDALVSEVELPKLLELVATRLRELVKARLVVIAMPTRAATSSSERWPAKASTSSSERCSSGEARSPAECSIGVAASESTSIIEDPEVDQDAGRRMGARTGLYVPLLLRGRPIGVLSAHDREGSDPRFTDEDLRLAETLSARVAVAVDLSQRVARDALRSVVSAQELERERLARELHDETGQALTSILLGLKELEDAGSAADVRSATARLRELVVTTLQDVRRLAVELRPKALDDFGLVPALERLVETFQEQTGIEVIMEPQLGQERLPSEIETALYRIIQEALTNVVKHAQASRVSIVLSRRGNSVSVVFEDDGRGFAVDETREDGLGLLGMKERLSLLDGRLQIESSSAGGTTLVAEVPVP